MIIDFTIENFRSIHEPICISFEPIQENSRNAFKTGYDDIPELFRVITIFGTNNSGKTNIIKALAQLVRMVKISLKTNKSTKLPAEPFFATKNIEDDTKFTIRILAKYNKSIALYTYTIAFDKEKIVFEKLVVTPNKEKEKILFSRKETRSSIQIHEKISYSKEKLDEEVFNKILLLSFLYEKTENKNIENIFRVIATINSLPSDDRSDSAVNITNSLIDDDENQITKEEILQFFNDADLNIHAINIQEKKIKFENLPKAVVNRFPEKFKNFLENKGEITTQKILFSKQNYKGDVFGGFDLKRTESEGTQRYYGLAGIIIDTISNKKTLIIDELSNSLHPALVLNVFKRFNSDVTNPNNAQFLFTTHATEILSSPSIIGDQVYLLSTNRNTLSTRMESIGEFKNHKDKLSSEGYLDGYFGAVPSTVLAPILSDKKEK